MQHCVIALTIFVNLAFWGCTTEDGSKAKTHNSDPVTIVAGEITSVPIKGWGQFTFGIPFAQSPSGGINPRLRRIIEEVAYRAETWTELRDEPFAIVLNPVKDNWIDFIIISFSHTYGLIQVKLYLKDSSDNLGVASQTLLTWLKNKYGAPTSTVGSLTYWEDSKGNTVDIFYAPPKVSTVSYTSHMYDAVEERRKEKM